MSQITNLAHPGSEPKNFTRVVHVLTERQHPVTLEQKVVESFERVGIDNSLEIVSETFSFYKHLCNLATQQYIAGRANFNKIHESQIVSAHKNPTPLDIDALASNVTEHLNIEHLSEIGQLSLYTKVAGLSHFLILEGTIAILGGGLGYLVYHNGFFDQKSIQITQKNIECFLEKSLVILETRFGVKFLYCKFSVPNYSNSYLNFLKENQQPILKGFGTFVIISGAILFANNTELITEVSKAANPYHFQGTLGECVKFIQIQGSRAIYSVAETVSEYSIAAVSGLTRPKFELGSELYVSFVNWLNSNKSR